MNTKSQLDELKDKLMQSGIDIHNASDNDILYNFEEALDSDYKSSHGIVYTPQWIASNMVKQALSHYCGDLLDIKICDPACGAGIYEIEVIKELIRLHKQNKSSLTDLEIAEHAISNNIYGIELDKCSVEVTIFRMWSYLVELGYDKPMSDMKHNIYNGNSIDSSFQGLKTNYTYTLDEIENIDIRNLYKEDWQNAFDDYVEAKKNGNNNKIWVTKANLVNIALLISADLKNRSVPFKYTAASARNSKKNLQFMWYAELSDIFKEKGGFDIVIGNPPYVRNTELFIDENDEEVDTLDEYKGVYKRSADLYIYFYELADKITNDSGYISLITPNKWFKAKYAENFRHWVLNADHRVNSIIDFNMNFVFSNAFVTVAVINIDKSKAEQNIKYINAQKLASDCIYPDTDNCICININNLDYEGFIFATERIYDIKRKLDKLTKIKELDNVQIFKGEVVKDQDRNSSGKVMLMKGEDVPYNKNEEFKGNIFTDLDIDTSKYDGCIVIPEISKNIRAYVVHNAVPLDSCTIIKCNDSSLVDVLNTELVDDIYSIYYCQNYMTGFAEVRFPRKTGAIGELAIAKTIEEYGLDNADIETLKLFRREYCGEINKDCK